MVNILVVPVIYGLEQSLSTIVIPASQLLLEIFLFPGKLELLEYEPRQKLFNIIRQKLVFANFVSLSLGGLSPQKLTITREYDL